MKTSLNLLPVASYFNKQKVSFSADEKKSASIKHIESKYGEKGIIYQELKDNGIESVSFFDPKELKKSSTASTSYEFTVRRKTDNGFTTIIDYLMPAGQRESTLEDVKVKKIEFLKFAINKYMESLKKQLKQISVDAKSKIDIRIAELSFFIKKI